MAFTSDSIFNIKLLKLLVISFEIFEMLAGAKSVSDCDQMDLGDIGKRLFSLYYDFNSKYHLGF